MKLDDGRLGVMGFNNMIPVLPSCLIEFNIQEVEDARYKMLLLNQLDFCNKHEEIIVHRAQTTYNRAVIKKVPMYKKVCCNFLKLERNFRKFDPHHAPKKKKASVTIPDNKA